ncbi:hypothetical protein AALP_AA8G154200 [Arabis alpina]|uniref:Auxin efflux carrier component n=1 Tax=Arabis alpina TaxID=50452 RepID=A0A087G794_ARAAL|nr:hypothetical protein AALP_AA8G154200 [Arabis alpina]
MSPKLIISDIIQKIFAVVVLAAVLRFWHPTGGRGGKLGWIITGLSISVLPNTLILGIPILNAIDGDEAVNFLVQIVVLQSLIWYNILLFMFELNAARAKTSPGASIQHTGNDNEEANIEQERKEEEEEEVAIVRTRTTGTGKILLKAWRKLIINPNTYATLIGLIWATLHFRLGWKLPPMIDKSIHLLSDGGLGMAMFSLGLFMASQSSIIACGTKLAIITMVLKFVLGPVLMIASAFCIRLRGNLFKVAIIQAALPQGVVPFVFAKEYNVHPEIVSTGVIFGMLIALPITLAYYFVRRYYLCYKEVVSRIEVTSYAHGSSDLLGIQIEAAIYPGRLYGSYRRANETRHC